MCKRQMWNSAIKTYRMWKKNANTTMQKMQTNMELQRKSRLLHKLPKLQNKRKSEKNMTQVEINTLKQIAIENKEKAIPEKDIRTQNITYIYRQELANMINAKETINIQIIGDPTHGKSTLASNETAYIMEKLLKKKMKEKYIHGNQIDYIRAVRKNPEKNICEQIDEYTTLGETGVNASTEQAWYDTFSDLIAQYYKHRISCSPRTITDPNAKIILQTYEPDRKNKTTTAQISYRFIDGTTETTQLIGHIKINIANTLEQKWYKQYRQKKEKRMWLLLNKGISDVRKLEEAKAIKKIYQNLKKLATTGYSSNALIRNEIAGQEIEEQLILSIIGRQEIMDQTKGLLDTEAETPKLQKKIMAIKINYNKLCKIQGKKTTDQTINDYQQAINDLQETQQRVLNRLEEKIKIKEDYEKLW